MRDYGPEAHAPVGERFRPGHSNVRGTSGSQKAKLGRQGWNYLRKILCEAGLALLMSIAAGWDPDLSARGAQPAVQWQNPFDRRWVVIRLVAEPRIAHGF
jgi:hypothetical protein